ncbi:MAG: tRNA (adenosine(37)-N6)-threonylcarbamoyltransferase complex ATPase subunit type 1 TsaE [Acidobacteriota bacterium]
MNKQTFLSHSPDETFAVGYSLGQTLAQQADAMGQVVLLSGELGCGKTQFVKGLAAALGLDPTEVTSPTFALVQAHAFQGGTLWHVDLYRLPTGPGAAEAVSLAELLEQPGIVAIEWPERLGLTLDTLGAEEGKTWAVQLDELEDGLRRITIYHPAPRLAG